MRVSGRSSSVALALTVSGIVALAPPAAASHYAFDQAPIVTPAERRALARAGILDTQVLLGWTASLSRRVWLARETRIDFDRLVALATRCDLLRVDGIGPSIAEVFQKAGVQDTRTLARATPEPVLERMRAVTRGTSMATRLPTEDTLATWIAAARRLRPLLEDIPEVEPPSGR